VDKGGEIRESADHAELYFDIIEQAVLKMLTTNLRKVGGSIMMVIPPAILDMLNLEAGSAVTLAVDEERLVVESPRRPRYTLEQLLAQSKRRARITKEDREWLDSAPVGRELL
jgi:antitoxin ChpS